MTLNCPVNQQGQPLALPNENFMLWRQNMQFQVNIEKLGKKSASGTAYLTTSRIIFVSSKPTPQFYSFDVPITNLFKQKVEFPIFGSTYLEGNSYPYQDMLPGLVNFKLYFKKGGCDTYIKILSRLIKQTRQKLSQNKSFLDSVMYNDIRSDTFNFNAYVNPNDPSKIYTEQPPLMKQ